MKNSFIRKSKWWWVPVILVLVAINYMAASYHSRIDLTNEKRFTLSSPTKRILSKLDEEVRVDVFLKGDFPSGFKKLALSTEELLQEFSEYSNHKLTYHFISADDKMEGMDRTFADTLAGLGYEPINLTVQLKAGEQSQYIYPAALVHYKGRVELVSLYPGTKKFISAPELNSAEALLEYRFANAINSLTQTNRPLVAYAVGNGEPTGANVFDLVENVLKKNYQLFQFKLNEEPVIPDTFKMMMIVKPVVPFTDAEKIKLDQYVMHGGKIFWAVDKLEAEMDSLQIKNEVIAYDRGLNLDDLLFKYGIRVNTDLLMDLQCDFLPFDVNGKGQFEYLHWNYFPLFESHANHVINKNLGLVAGRFVNSIDTVKAEEVTKTVLLSSSTNARLISTPARISGEENRNATVDQMYTKKDIIAGVLMEGKFRSLYANRMSAAMMDTLQHYGSPFLTSCIQPNKMIYLADGDIVLNSVSKDQPLPMGMNPYTVGSQYEYRFSNKEFVQNCIEYLVNPSGLSEAKSKDYTLRLLDPKKVTENRTLWQAVNLVVPVLLVLFFAIFYQWRRKRKYSA